MKRNVYVDSFTSVPHIVIPTPSDAYTPYIGPAVELNVKATLGSVVVNGFPASLIARRSAVSTDYADIA